MGSMAEVEAMAIRQKRQIEELNKLQSALDEIKKKVGGPGAGGDDGTILARVTW